MMEVLKIFFLIWSVSSTKGYVPVPSCGVLDNNKEPCDTHVPSQDLCEAIDCCWDEKAPHCFKPVMRSWTPCSRKCNKGERQEEHRNWVMECHNFPCKLKTTCKIQRSDIIFLLDGSQSIKERNFFARKQLLIDITMALSQIGHDTNFAMITYGHEGRIRFDFNEGFSLDNLDQMTLKIWEMEYMADQTGTNMADALHKAVQMFLIQGRQDSDVKKIALAITDGKATKVGQIPKAIKELQNAGVTTYAIGREEIHDMEMIRSLTQQDSHVFTILDYGRRLDLVTALVTEFTCASGMLNSFNIQCDDVCDVYINGDYESHVMFQETWVFTVQEAVDHLVAIKLTNKLNPAGRWFEIWPSSPHGLKFISDTVNWRCTTVEEPGWHEQDFDDSRWKPAELPSRHKDGIYVGSRGQRKIWAPGSDWGGYCRGWIQAVRTE